MVLSMERWAGKVAVVTGASAGIGRVITEHLVKNGLIVVGFARRKELIEKLALELASSAKGKLYAVQVDMTKEEDIIRGFEWTKENVGPVHILVNNAGTALQGNLLDGDTQAWKTTLDLNVLGLCIATREAIKIMREQGIDGHVVHINSVFGHIAKGVFNVYCASKHAVTALTETLRQELNAAGSKIKISSVSPGLVESEITQSFVANAPHLKGEDVADAVVYVLSTPPHVQVHEVIIRPIGET